MSIESKLVVALQSNNKEKIRTLFEQIYIDYKGLVVFIASKYIKNNDEIKDIVHDVFLNFFNNANKITSNIKSYLTSTTKNMCLKHLDYNRNIIDIDIVNYENIVEETSNSSIDYQNLLSRLKQLLSIDELKILLNHIINEVSFKDIAIRLNKSENTIKTTYYRSLNKINKLKGELR